MRTIIAGSRSFAPRVSDPWHVRLRTLERLRGHVSDAMEAFEIMAGRPTRVLSGRAQGPDQAGEEWADARGIPVEPHRAQWELHARMAGLWRNLTMADNADALVAVYDGQSRGTGHMITVARDRGLLVLVWEILQ